ncbi:MAG: hypothetical protein DSY80_05605 [Desulfocapsa sp.]|nr:MAG: hypothetical protein DSY80_05605 [Desulfocapsa sp.]
MYRSLLVTLLLLTFSQNLQASQSRIPEELQKWIPWVLYEQEEKICTLNANKTSQRFCIWPSTLNLSVDENGAEFTQKYLVETESFALLPGAIPFWPRDLQNDGEELLLSRKGKHPGVWLEAGDHVVTGKFKWKTLPEYLQIPSATGLINLKVHGETVKNIQLDKQGRLWFKQKKQQIKTDAESLSLQVFRKIEDGVPLLQHIRILLTVSGAPRKISLGLGNSQDFVPLSLQSPLPIRFDELNRLQLQVRPGQWDIRFSLRNISATSPKSLGRGKINGPWPQQEIWVFAADQKLRQVQITGVPAIDPSRTSLPEEWKMLPAYLLQGNNKMQFIEKNRGNPNPVPNRLIVNRNFWLDELGTGLTVLDSISGTMTSKWRLNVAASQDLGKVTVDGKARLITRLDASGKTGVEVRKGNLSLQAESRIETAVQGSKLTIPAIGWDHTVQQLSGHLNLPPGWKLLSATGVDKVSTWLNRWSLLDIFLVLIIALATTRILGLFWGFTAFTTLTLAFHQAGSPTYIWLPLLAALGLQKIIHSTTAERITRMAGLAILAVLIVTSIPFMVQEIRVGIYPQLEYGSYRKISSEQKAGKSRLTATPMALEDEIIAEQSLPAPKAMGRNKLANYSVSSSSAGAVTPSKIEIDPQEMIQTGPGLPNWSWTRIALRWNGPVNPEQKISFILLSPLMGTVLAFVRVILLALLIFGFLRKCTVSYKRRKKKQKIPTAAIKTAALIFLLFATIAFPQYSQAEIPSVEILKELQNRLLAPPDCGKDCVSINGSLITIENDQLTLQLQVDSDVRVALPLPGKNRFFDSISLGQEKLPSLTVNKKGFTNIRITRGSHIITLKKDLADTDRIALYFPIVPAIAQASLQGWTINGLRDDGRLAQQISFQRLKNETDEEITAIQHGTTLEIPPFIQIERTLHVNLKWTVSTKIIRRNSDSVVALDIPLLQGEHVTSDGFQIRDKHIRINMAPGQQSLIFHSSMEPVDKLLFTAEKTSSWNEIWFLDISPVWHVKTTGIPEINQTSPAGKRFPEFHPYPGESLQLHVLKPEGVPGPTMTINKSSLVTKPGRRATETTLSLSLTASRGMQHSIELPPGIEVQKTLINNKEIPLQLENNRLTLPLSPGEQHVEIGWRSTNTPGFKTLTESINLGVNSVNHSIQMQVPASRWILFIGGPRVGPAVLFWGELLVIILVALGLGRVSLTPLSTTQWLLLSLGLSQIHASLAAVVVAWLLLLGLRKKQGQEIKQVIPFNLLQVLLVILTLFALATLFFAIQQGLLGHPDMQIGGNGSSGHRLFWYQDRVNAQLPTAWVFTVPLLVYRIAMLLWALWLAIALLRWLRWGWDCFSSGTTWKKVPPRKKIVRKPKQKTDLPPTGKIVKKRVRKVLPKKPANETRQ